MTPKQLAHYEILETLGTGGMGEVYRARDTKLNREVALKTILPQLAADPARLERFQQEAKALAALDHPNIVTVFSVDEDQGIHFLTMGLVTGKTLDQVVSDTGMELDLFFDLSVPILDAMAVAHARGIVHRDLKPANVMLTDEGRVKVLDFGLAKLLEAPSGDQAATALAVTQPGQVWGTIPYMSPEQVNGAAVTASTDIFSLGVIFHELLSGEHPFAAETSAKTMAAILRDRPKSIDRKDLPEPLVAACLACLEKTPGRRPTAADLRDRFKEIQKSSAVIDVAGRETRTRSIAVLPFADLSPARDQEYFCDGMADEILNALTKIEALQVMSRTSSFAFKGRSEDVREIARTLDVDIVLEGSLRRAGNRIRISTQLVNAKDGYNLWSDRFDRNIEDVFEVQDEIAGKVAGALRIVLTGRETEALQRLPTNNLEAYELYLRARAMLIWFSDEKFKAAQALFRRATELDSEFLPAWFGLVEVSGWIYQWGINARSAVDLQTVIQASERAMAIAPDRAEAQAARGMAAWFQDDPLAAIPALEKAQQLDPRLWEAAYFLGRIRMAQREFEPALEQFNKAIEIRPDDYSSLILMTGVLEALGRQTEVIRVSKHAARVFERHLGLHPDDARAYYLGASSLQILGEVDKGREWARRALQLAPEDGGARYNIACFHVRLGELDEALDLLEAAVASGWGNRVWLSADPDMDPLRDHPRFRKLMERIGT